MRAARRGRGAGFSLVEVLVAAAGTLLLLGLLYGAMSRGSSAVRRTEGELASQSEAIQGVERMFATLRLAHSASVRLLSAPPALSFLAPDRPAAPSLTPVPGSAYVYRGFQTEPLAWKRFLVYYYNAASRELRCMELPYPPTLQYRVACLEPQWLIAAVTREAYPRTVTARFVEAVQFARNRPPSVEIDLTVLRTEVGQKQETRLRTYVTPRNG